MEAVAFALSTLGVGFQLREEAGLVEVDVGVEELPTEGVDPGGEALGDVGIAQVLSHDAGVFGLGQSVVVALPGSGAGEFGVQPLQQPRHGVVDLLRAVVGVEARDLEGEVLEQLLEHGQQ